MSLLAWIVGGLLCAFTLRRALFWLASLAPARACRESRSRSIAVLVAAHNEAKSLPRLFAALRQSDYPRELVNFVIVSDGSTDATPSLITSWAADTPRAVSVVLPVTKGKGAALQAALACMPARDLVVVLDADAVPEPAALARLAGAFDDPAVGAASGYADPGLSQTSNVARYAALERWVTHLVTLAGKDRLGMRPQALGAFCAVRTQALAAVGGFVQGAMGEDIELSMALSRAGWKTRWIRGAVAREDVPVTPEGFRLQRLRWSRGLMASRGGARGLEDRFVAAGYIDRLAFVAAAALTAAGALPIWVMVVSAGVPLAIIVTALCRARAPDKIAYLASIVPMAVADVLVTAESTLAQATKAPLRWERT